MVQAFDTPGNCSAGIHFCNELVDRYSRTPLILRLQLDYGLGHFERRRVGRGGSTPSLAIGGLNLGEGFDDAVLRLQEFGGLGDREPGSVVGM